MSTIILAAEMQLLIEKHGEEAAKEALMKALEKDIKCPEE